LLAEHGGAVLADAVGLGKTYVALALASRADAVLVVCPGGLRDLWEEASGHAGVRIATVTVEAMSRMGPTAGPHGRRPNETTAQQESHSGVPSHDSRCGEWVAGHMNAGHMKAGLVIVDEAHHFRNPRTRRFRALARLTTGARVLLLTATPIHNRTGDLAALLSLFLGAHAWTLTEDQRAQHVVRRDHDLVRDGRASPLTSPTIPQVDGPHVVGIGDDEETLRAIVALPPPVPPRDGETCSALTAMGLVRQWSSSAGALRAALRRRLERAVALEAALEQDAYPSYRDLRDWCLGDGAIQLALPELLLSSTVLDAETPRPGDRQALVRSGLLDAVRRHAAGVRALLCRLETAADIDATRADRLRAIARAHAGSQVVAFSAYEDTVRALYRLLRADGRVCALSGKGGMIAGGQLNRADVVRQFAPGGRQSAPQAARIDLLLTTDLLSEGVNLQGASAVVHLDLPWTPARLEQRVGRVARLGSPHLVARVYAFAPPAAADVLLGVERRLRAKLDAAGRSIGIAGSIVPPMSATVSGDLALPADLAPAQIRPAEQRRLVGPPEHLAFARSVVGRWRHSRDAAVPTAANTLWACAGGAGRGFVAACMAGGRAILLGAVDGPASDAPHILATAVRWAEGEPAIPDPIAYEDAIRAIREWWLEQCAGQDAGLSTIAGAEPRLRVLGRIAAITRRTPMHARPTVLALADRARRAAAAPFGSGAEWVLDQLAGAPMADTQWLRAVAAFGDAHRRHAGSAAPPDRRIEVAALIVVGPEHEGTGTKRSRDE